jgi:hypothetical protein
MDKKEFRTRLAELAEFEDETPRLLRLEPGALDPINEVVYDGEVIELERTFNPTLGIKFIRLKPRMEICEIGCGNIIDRQVLEKNYTTYPVPHWRTKCRTCGKYQHPSGDGLIEDKGTTIANTFATYYRNRDKERYQKIMQSKPRG